MVITATYTDGTTAIVSNYIYTPTSVLNTIGSQAVLISYSENGLTYLNSVTITVNRKKISIPTWKSNLTYNGNTQHVDAEQYWNNYDSSKMVISGTTSGTNASTYSASFTPGSNYQWSDETTSAKSVNWTINKATGYLYINGSVSSPTVSLDSSNSSYSATITGSGTISYTPTSVTGLTLSLSNGTFTVKATANVSSQIITIKCAASTNYTAPANLTITVSANVWSWGDETAVGDADWWARLKSWASTASATERSDCVGKKKLVSLSTSVLGANAATMICIGADQDGSNTLTFQTAGVLPNTTAFSSSSAVWIGSTARTLCQNFYNYCSAKNSIKTISKGTCASTNSSKSGTATYNDETVFLPSEAEMGLDSYSSLTYSNSTTSNAECTKGLKFKYSYYSSNTTRIKYVMSADGTIGSTAGYYWERSRYYNSGNSNIVCHVYGDGSAVNSGYYNSCYLAPAFAIG